jgi:hypothetical protein
MALGDREEAGALMHVANQPASSSLLPMGSGHKQTAPGISETGVERVQVGTLAREIDNGKISAKGHTLLKMDVQGYEQNVLIGAADKLRCFDWIVFETSCFPLYEGETTFEDIARWLREAGFAFYGPMDIHFAEETGKIRQFEALFYKLTP